MLAILFAKAAIPGRVKTRLAPLLSPAAAADLHRAMVRDALDVLRQLPGLAIELHTDIPTDEWRECAVTTRLQAEGELGIRMLRSLGGGLAAGYRQVVLVGADSPGLPPGHVAGLLRLDADVALGPADDGGYWGIAARRVSPRMFDGVAWSTGQTLEQTVAAARRAGLTVETGSPWFDVDQPEDFRRMLAEGRMGRHVLEWARARGLAAGDADSAV